MPPSACLRAASERDPAAQDAANVYLHHKGFQALQAHRLANGNTLVGMADPGEVVEVDASASKWKMWSTALENVAARTALVQDYVEKRENSTSHMDTPRY